MGGADKDAEGGVGAGRANEVLAGLLARAGWTPENLGDRLNKLAVTQRLGLHSHRRSPRRWVYAEPGRLAPRVPREPWPSLVCHVLHERLGEVITPEELGWSSTGSQLRYVPADQGLDQAWTAGGAVQALADVVDAGGMDRRHFLALSGITLTSAAHEWLGDPARIASALAGKRIGHDVVDDLERVAETKRHLDDALGGGTLLPSVREDLRLVVAMLRNASYTEQVGRRLYAVAAELGRLAGWSAYDSNDHAVAQRYWLAALRAAHTSGDRAAGANILGFMSVQSAPTDRPRDAVLLAESALRVEQHLTPAVAALLHSRLAFAAARTGDEPGWRRAQNRAETLFSRSVSADEPAWVYWFTEAELEGVAGTSLLEFGRPAEAEPHLRRAVMLIDPSFARDRAMWLSDLAAARVGSGAVEHACATASEAAALMRRLESPRDQLRLARFRRAAAPFATTSAVREFDSRYRDLLSRSVASM
ncbi:MAG TPA: hypothetical protein VGM60_02310 [Pseudonocardia sp.]|uniref:hypothetical protein n=1 Tax=Pseudonocardia sp. TaxID=60912 RepID=UPI002F40E1E5